MIHMYYSVLVHIKKLQMCYRIIYYDYTQVDRNGLILIQTKRKAVKTMQNGKVNPLFIKF